jgi:4-diphosphocytidyl-2-C-methyl-D-erythritol kinase
VASPVASWREKLTNDFEETILKIHPEIGKIKESLYGQGAIFSQMSGSGSAVYALFDNKPTDLNQPQYENCFISVFPLTKVINM